MTRAWLIVAVAVWIVECGYASPPAAPQPEVPPQIAKLASQAEAAAKAGRREEALRLYGQALAAVPTWEEGWWHVGTIHYDADRFGPCRDSFRKLTSLNPKMARGFAFLGLCEYQTKEFGPALIHLEKAYEIGLEYEESLTRVALYHAAVLQTHASNFERALQICRLLIRIKPNDPATIAVAGIAALRRPIFPQELPGGDRDVAFKLGSAMLTGGEHPIEDATKRFEDLVKEYPDTPNIHYSYAMILLANDPDRGVAALQRELEINPKHLPSLVSMGFEYLKRGDPEKALPYAERAVVAGPGNFAAHGCLGRTLVEMGEAERGAKELEAAIRLEPSSPQLHYLLATAYTKLGRKAEAAREREAFSRLRAAKNERLEGDVH